MKALRILLVVVFLVLSANVAFASRNDPDKPVLPYQERGIFGTVDRMINGEKVPVNVEVWFSSYDGVCNMVALSVGGFYEVNLSPCFVGKLFQISVEDVTTSHDWNNLPAMLQENFVIGNCLHISGNTGPEVEIVLLFNGRSNNGCVNYYSTRSFPTGEYYLHFPECVRGYPTVTVLAFSESESQSEIVPVEELLQNNVRNYLE